MKELLKRSWIAIFRLKNRMVGPGFFVVILTITSWLTASPVWAQAKEDAGKGPSGVEMFLTGINWVLTQIASAITGVFQLVMDGLIVVMGYTQFTTNPFVSLGWAVVRDAMNLFYVIILIVIAMGVIFGQSKFKWQQQIPRLLIFALVINFSKLLCGLMLDFSQVIMLTFVNALKDFQGGNMLAMMGITDVYKINNGKVALLGNDASGAMQFANLLVVIMVLAGVTVTVGILFAVMVYRIVLIWILLVLAPLAWFVGSAKDLLGSGAYETWWKKWKCALIIGPLLSFFLWLTLAVAGSGSIALDSGFVTQATANNNSSNLLSDIFSSSKFISMILGLAMLFAGLEAAAEVCAGEGMIKGLVGTAQKWTKKATTGAMIGAAGLAYLKGREGMQFTKDMTTKGAKALGAAGSSLTSGLVGGAAGAMIGRGGAVGKMGQTINLTRRAGRAAAGGAVAGYLASKGFGRLAGAASSYAQSAQQKVAADYKGAAGSLGAASTDDQVSYLSAMADKGGPGVMDKRKTMELMAKMMADPKKREALEKSGKLENLFKAVGKDTLQTFKGDKDLKSGLDSFAKSRPDLTGDISGIDNMEDVRSLSTAALAKKEIQDRVAQIKAPENSGVDNLLEYIKAGRMGNAKAQAANLGQLGILQTLRPEELARQDPQAVLAALTQATDAGAVKDVLSRSPQLAADILGNQEMAGTLQAQPAVLNAALAAGAGVSGGQVTDQDKFSRMMRTNAKALQHLNLGGNNDLKRATLGAIGGASVGSLIASIKSNPAGNAGLRSKLQELSDYAAHNRDAVSDEGFNSMVNFDDQMRTLDDRQAAKEGKAFVAEQKAGEKAAAAAPDLAMGELEAARKEVKDAEAAVAKITQQIERNRTKAESALEAGKGKKYIAKTAQEQKMLQEQAAAQEKLQAAQTREQTAGAAQRPFEQQQLQNQIAALRAERESFANVAEKTLEEAEKLAEIEANLDAKYARLADLDQNT